MISGKAIKHVVQSHLITLQEEVEAGFLDELRNGNYTPEHPLVKRNPYLVSPLTAMVLFKTSVPQEVTVTVRGREQAGNIRHTFPRSTVHILPIYGLYPDWENQVDLVLSGGTISTIRIRTEPLPQEVPVPTYCKACKEHLGDNVIFLTQTSKAHALACDYKGDVRWYLTINVCFDLKRLRNGHLLVGTDRLIMQPYYVTGVYEMGIHGKIYHEYRLPGGYHHDTCEMEDGNLLMLSQEPDTNTVEDVLFLVDRQTGNILRSWDFKEFMPYDCPSTYSGSGNARDWFHSNALWYNKSGNSITISGRHQDAVANINYDTGELNWVIADPDGWPEEFKEKYLLHPQGDDFEWSYEQHGCVMTLDGDVLMFDNGHYRSKRKECYRKAADSYSRGVRYHIDSKTRTIRQVWQYGKERGADFFSPYISNVEYYGEGRYMVHSGGIAYKDGKPLDGLGSFEAVGADAARCSLISITCEIVNDEVVYELHVPSNAFRAEKLPLYYAGETAEIGKGKVLGEMAVTTEFHTIIPAVSKGITLPEHYEAVVVEEEDRIRFSAVFEKGELAMLLFTGENKETHYYYINTSAFRSSEAMCVGTFLKNDPRNVDVFVNKEGLKGTYQIQVVSGDIIYETGVQITV